MNRIVLPCALLATVALTLPAHAALSTRTFVSSLGNDTNPCTIAQPCATFAHAYTLTAATGIIAALDPGKYGPLTITQSITVNGNGWSATTAPAGGTGITINAQQTDKIYLIGLEVDGAGAAFNGIVLHSGGRLVISNCTLKDYVLDLNNLNANNGNGIAIVPTAGAVNFDITDTTVSGNVGSGIVYAPPSGAPAGKGIIRHVDASNNPGNGITIDATSATGGTATVTISDSVASNNNDAGVFVDSSTIQTRLSIDNLIAATNGTGIEALNNPNVLIGRSVITNNNVGIQNSTSPNNFYTYGDNRIDFNNTNFSTAEALSLKPVQ